MLETRMKLGDVGVTVFRPSDGDSSATLLWASGARALGVSDTAADVLPRSLAKRSRCTVVSVGYRFGREHCFPAGLTDYYRTLEWIRGDNAPSALSAGRVAVGGDGIGAGVAAAATVLADRYGLRGPTAQILVAPLLDARMVSPSWKRHRDGVSEKIRAMLAATTPGLDRADPLISPLLTKDPEVFPSTIIVTAELDPMRDDGERFAARLCEAKIPVWGHRYVQTTHGEACDGGRSAAGRRVVAGLGEAIETLLST
jgi:acetyl esterase